MRVNLATLAVAELSPDDHAGVASVVRSIVDAAPSPVSLLLDARAPALRDDAVATYRMAHASGLVRVRPVALFAPDLRTLCDALDLLLGGTNDADASAVVLAGVEREGRWAIAGAVVGGDACVGEFDRADRFAPFTSFLQSVEPAVPAATES